MEYMMSRENAGETDSAWKAAMVGRIVGRISFTIALEKKPSAINFYYDRVTGG
jgi:hypothetical protein